MSCDVFDRLVSDRLGGALPEVEALRLEEHLQHCERCAREAELAEEVVESARLAPPTAEESASIGRMSESIRVTFRSGQRRPSLRAAARWSVPWLGAAVAAGLALSVSLHRPHTDLRPTTASNDDSEALVAWALTDPSADVLASESSDDDLSNAFADDSDLGAFDDDGASP